MRRTSCFSTFCLKRRMFTSMIATAKRLKLKGLQVWMTDNRCRYWTVMLGGLLSIIIIFGIFLTLTSNSDIESIPESGVQTSLKSHAKLVEPLNPRTNWAQYQYAIVLDCGSSGSRIFIYYWPEHSGIRGQLLDVRQLLDPEGHPAVLKVEPGLSAFPNDPSKATDQVVKLLLFAKDHIPVQCHKDVFVYIMATAGMRMLKEIDQENILSHIRLNVPLRTPFRLMAEHVEVITGKWEGIYAWIAINAALGRLGNTPDRLRVPDSTPEPATSDTVGIIDMGGGSIQIAFELDQKDHPPPDVMASFSLGSSDEDLALNYRLYVATYLGLGANSAIKSHFEALAEDKYKLLAQRAQMASAEITSTAVGSEHPMIKETIVDPCHPAGYNAAFNLTIPSNDNKPQPIILNGSGEFTSCKNRLQYLLASISTESNQAMANCGLFCSPLSGLSKSIAIAAKPPSSMKTKKFYGFSEFWYTMEDCLHLGGNYDSARFDQEAGAFCAQEWQHLLKDYSQPQYTSADYARFTTQCFKSAWVSVILHSGFLFDKETTNFASVQKINGSEVHWTLGALLYKTRTLPLRRIQLLESAAVLRHGVGSVASGSNSISVGTDSSSFHFVPYLPQVTIVVCGVIVFLAIGFYCHSLSKWRSNGLSNRRQNNSSLYDQAEMGLLSEEASDKFNSGGWSSVNEGTQTSDGWSEVSLNSSSGGNRKNRMNSSQSVGSRMHHLA